MPETLHLERFNGEIKRRTKVIRIFPNSASCLRLVTALCMEQFEEWVTGRKYVNEGGLDELLKENRSEREETNDSDLNLQQEVVLA